MSVFCVYVMSNSAIRFVFSSVFLCCALPFFSMHFPIVFFHTYFCAFFFFFFFSSRRRHTRYIGDWSSDVCSSDLEVDRARVGVAAVERALRAFQHLDALHVVEIEAHQRERGQRYAIHVDARGRRSEERRVGKECRSRWSPYQLKKKNRRTQRQRRH